MGHGDHLCPQLIVSGGKPVESKFGLELRANPCQKF